MDYDVAMLSGLTLKVVEVARLTGRFLLNERLVFDRLVLKKRICMTMFRMSIESLSAVWSIRFRYCCREQDLSPKRRLFLIGERLVYGLSIRSTVRPIMFMTSLLML